MIFRTDVTGLVTGYDGDTRYACGGKRGVVVLTTGTELQYLDEDDATVGQRPDQRWLQFRTATGEEGWIREIDDEPMSPRSG